METPTFLISNLKLLFFYIEGREAFFPHLCVAGCVGSHMTTWLHVKIEHNLIKERNITTIPDSKQRQTKANINLARRDFINLPDRFEATEDILYENKSPHYWEYWILQWPHMQVGLTINCYCNHYVASVGVLSVCETLEQSPGSENIPSWATEGFNSRFWSTDS